MLPVGLGKPDRRRSLGRSSERGGIRAAALIGLGLVVACAVAILLLPSLWSGTARITLNEPDAEATLLIDDRPISITGPEQAISLRMGHHRLTVDAPGFEPFLTQFFVKRGQPVVVFADLKPAQQPAAVHHANPLPRRIVNQADGSVLLLIPAGPFRAGAWPGVAPAGRALFKVDLSAFYLGLTEVTNAQYKKFVDATGHRPPQVELGPSLWEAGSFPADKANHPVVGVSWEEADAYCRWAGLRLPTELEWEKGARGLDGWDYPWGNTWDKSKCQNNLSRHGQSTSDVLAYPESRSPWGLYNMAGNAYEWCADALDTDAYRRYEKGDLSTQPRGPYRVLRGGGWDMEGSGFFNSRFRNGSPAQARYPSNGFRVAKSAPVSASAAPAEQGGAR